MQEAMLWHKERNGVRCDLCARNCFIPKDKRGFCNVRINKNNKLYSLNYGKLCSVNIDPIEKKPLFHFYPGSNALSISSPGCNFRCLFCCNWNISQSIDVTKEEIEGEEYSPEDIVEIAEKNNCKIISYTYTEPTVFFEFAYRTAKLAHRSNILNTFVTNGYISKEAVKKIAKYLDAATVDFKASADPEFYKKFMSVPSVEPIFDCLKQMKKQRIFIEITNLIIPKFGDSIDLCTKLAQWISSELNPDIPFHIIQFFPSYQLLELPPTPISTLEKCIEESRKTGLRYVYIGNVPGHPDENTYCYNCRELLIKRHGFAVEKKNLVGDRCPTCGLKINVLV
ncbi:MAG: AmmeMemoRadiSam system radical SAM enzyme [Candidatus Aenigmatarchaeota archaeon]